PLSRIKIADLHQPYGLCSLRRPVLVAWRHDRSRAHRICLHFFSASSQLSRRGTSAAFRAAFVGWPGAHQVTTARHRHRCAVGRIAITLLPAITVVLGSGSMACSRHRDRWQRIPLRGTVKSKQVANTKEVEGSITLLPAVGVAGPSATTSITAGRYQFDK